MKCNAEAVSIPANFLEITRSVLYLEPVAVTEASTGFLSPPKQH